jgi:DNA-binding response OmpR family regulator
MQAVVVSDDPDEKDVLTFLLRKVGLAVASTSDLDRILKTWTDHPADLIVISFFRSSDLVSLIDNIRGITQVPVIIITDPIAEALYCELIERGTDGVLTRPVSHRVISAHIKALIKRSQTIPGFVFPTLDLADISLDPSNRMVTVFEEEPTRLTALEFRLLYTLMTNRGQVIPLDIIVERVWGYTGKGNQDLVRGLVSRLRKKIELYPEQHKFLETIPGVGYRFADEKL